MKLLTHHDVSVDLLRRVELPTKPVEIERHVLIGHLTNGGTTLIEEGPVSTLQPLSSMPAILVLHHYLTVRGLCEITLIERQ